MNSRLRFWIVLTAWLVLAIIDNISSKSLRDGAERTKGKGKSGCCKDDDGGHDHDHGHGHGHGDGDGCCRDNSNAGHGGNNDGGCCQDDNEGHGGEDCNVNNNAAYAHHGAFGQDDDTMNVPSRYQMGDAQPDMYRQDDLCHDAPFHDAKAELPNAPNVQVGNIQPDVRRQDVLYNDDPLSDAKAEVIEGPNMQTGNAQPDTRRQDELYNDAPLHDVKEEVPNVPLHKERIMKSLLGEPFLNNVKRADENTLLFFSTMLAKLQTYMENLTFQMDEVRKDLHLKFQGYDNWSNHTNRVLDSAIAVVRRRVYEVQWGGKKHSDFRPRRFEG